MLLGIVMTVASVLLAAAIIGFGNALPTYRVPFNSLMIAVDSCSVFCLFLLGCGLMLSRQYAPGEYLNVAGARPSLRLFLALWVCTIPITALSCLLFVALLNTPSTLLRGQQIQVATAVGYLLLLLSPTVLAGVCYFVARYLLRPSPALLRKHGSAPVGLPQG